jgi:hypothetical protein
MLFVKCILFLLFLFVVLGKVLKYQINLFCIYNDEIKF